MKILFGIIFFFYSTLCYADIATGLVGWWKFDEASSGTCSGSVITDSSGNGNTGTCNNSPTWIAGHIGRGAMSFNGSNQYVSAGNGSYLTQWTVSGWVYPSSYTNYSIMINRGINTDRNYSLYITKNTGTVTVAYTNASSDYWLVVSNGTVPLNKWSFVTGTFDGSTIKVYINGVFDNSLSAAFTPENESGITIGKEGSDYFTGSLDDVRIYNRALSAADVAQLYNVQSTIFLNKAKLNNFKS